MIAGLVVLALELVAIIVFAPVRVKIKYYFSLSRDKSIALIRFFGIDFIKFIIEEKDGKFELSLNGNPIKNKKQEGGFPVEKLPKLFTYIRAEKLVGAIFVLAYVGGSDAMDCAVKCTLANIVYDAVKSLLGVADKIPSKEHSDEKQLMLADFYNDRLDFSIRLRGKINLFQTLELTRLMRSQNKKRGKI